MYVVSSGREIMDNWPTIALLTSGVVVGTILGAPILRRMPEVLFRRLLATSLVVLGVALIAGASR